MGRRGALLRLRIHRLGQRGDLPGGDGPARWGGKLLPHLGLQGDFSRQLYRPGLRPDVRHRASRGRPPHAPGVRTQADREQLREPLLHAGGANRVQGLPVRSLQEHPQGAHGAARALERALRAGQGQGAQVHRGQGHRRAARTQQRRRLRGHQPQLQRRRHQQAVRIRGSHQAEQRGRAQGGLQR